MSPSIFCFEAQHHISGFSWATRAGASPTVPLLRSGKSEKDKGEADHTGAPGNSSHGHQIQSLPGFQLCTHAPSADTTLGPCSGVWGTGVIQKRGPLVEGVQSISRCDGGERRRQESEPSFIQSGIQRQALQRQWISGKLMTWSLVGDPELIFSGPDNLDYLFPPGYLRMFPGIM